MSKEVQTTQNQEPSNTENEDITNYQPLMPFLKLRVIETFVITFILSLIVSGLFYYNVFEMTRGNCAAAIIICLAVNILLHYLCHRRHLLTVFLLHIYYRVNITAVLIVSLAALLLACFNIEPLFTFLFSPYKLWNIACGFSKVQSVLTTSGIYLAVTLITPAIS